MAATRNTSTITDARATVEAALKSFAGGAKLRESSLTLLGALGYRSEKTVVLDSPTFEGLRETFSIPDEKLNAEKALAKQWKRAEFLFQLGDSEVSGIATLFQSGKWSPTEYQSFVFLAVELERTEYKRSELVAITRELNLPFNMPVIVLFYYGGSLTLSVIDRRLNKRDVSKDVLEKVTLIKDIRLAQPHRAHVEILEDLSLQELARVHELTSFSDLHKAWKTTLNISELNKRFFRELADWYFWAHGQVRFPADLELSKDEEKDEELRNATGLIRLITRVIFIWFIREKGLVPDTLFSERELKSLVKDFGKRSSDNYYPAILQNLFFGTLNQRMKERAFAKDEGHLKNREEHGVKNLYRHADKFLVDEKAAMKLFADVPFLNGGLFDCLDKPDESGKVVYVDGFSRSPKKQTRIPDTLFFSEEPVEVDLTDWYDPKAKKRTVRKVKGLFNILSAYKFTVTENTPLEEEIALDPELLGKVFENLLASYNEETKTTARKQTGSFYTPPEIVNYMVDESLCAYLLHAKADVADEAAIRALLSYSEEGPKLSESKREALIAAIDRIKILDPACGSGAFPMGILHKLVHLLHKLDPRNELWYEQQKRNAESIQDIPARDAALTTLEEAFNANELDYSRKLYLIENCIYGVDIQPVAVQIAKLRFFISLVIDEHVDEARDNRGIRSLPNLETKFVAANTLIGLKKPVGGQLLIRNLEIERKEDALKALRHRYFSATTRREKLKLQKEDKALREEIAALLRGDGWDKSTADLVAKYDPYDGMRAASWFDAEWMFGLKAAGVGEGVFDVVIGNPPYVQIQKLDAEVKAGLETQKYETYTRTGDLYQLFYESGVKTLAPGGHLCFISSNKWMRTDYGEVTRTFFSKKCRPKVVIDFGMAQMFESATTYTNILLLQKEKPVKKFSVCRVNDDYFRDMPLGLYVLVNGVQVDNPGGGSWIAYDKKAYNLIRKIEAQGVPLKDWDLKINYGIKTGFNEAFIIDTPTRDRLVAEDPKSAEITHKILRGEDVKAYVADWAGLWLINTHNGNRVEGTKPIDVKRNYPAVYKWLSRFSVQLQKRQDKGDHWTNLRNCAYVDDFSKPKIIYPNMTKYLPFVYDRGSFVCNDKAFILTGQSLEYLTLFLNSTLFKFAFKDYFPELLGDTREVRKVFFETVPVRKPVNESWFRKKLAALLVEKAKGRSITDLLMEVDNAIFDIYSLNSTERALMLGTTPVSEPAINATSFSESP